WKGNKQLSTKLSSRTIRCSGKQGRQSEPRCSYNRAVEGVYWKEERNYTRMREQPWHKEADDLYKQGYSGRKIADILGMSKTQVNDYLKYAFRGEERVSEGFL